MSLRNPAILLAGFFFLYLTYLDLENYAQVLHIIRKYSFNEKIIYFYENIQYLNFLEMNGNSIFKKVEHEDRSIIKGIQCYNVYK